MLYILHIVQNDLSIINVHAPVSYHRPCDRVVETHVCMQCDDDNSNLLFALHLFCAVITGFIHHLNMMLIIVTIFNSRIDMFSVEYI